MIIFLGCGQGEKKGLVEAAGIEPDSPLLANWLMARDFRSNLHFSPEH